MISDTIPRSQSGDVSTIVMVNESEGDSSSVLDRGVSIWSHLVKNLHFYNVRRLQQS